jgi:3-phytase
MDRCRWRESIFLDMPLVLALTLCAFMAADAAAPESTDTAKVARVREAFESVMSPADNIDSPASWRAASGATWVIATAKATDQLVVYDGDTGRTLQRIGNPGQALGQFDRPNGVFVIDDYLFVVERDNRRVQLFALPRFEPLLTFGAETLRKPYGIWVRASANDFDVWITDSYETPLGTTPPLAELTERIKRFTVERRGSRWSARLVAQIGDPTPAGALRIVESIWGDETHDRVLIAEEDESYASELKVYTLSGRFTNRTLGRDRFAAQAEGIALYTCRDGSGYWITTAQGKEHTVFHLFERASLNYAGAFRGERVANTDGIWLQGPTTSGRFPAGVLYAVHDDQGVVAFDWREIARALGIAERCPD